MATEGLLTHIVTGKFCVSLPLYRKKRIFRRMEADVLGNYLDLVEATSDNNPVENAICPFVVGRKNWLFSASPRGASASVFSTVWLKRRRPTSLSRISICNICSSDFHLVLQSSGDAYALEPKPSGSDNSRLSGWGGCAWSLTDI